jgi:hypothetical protein
MKPYAGRFVIITGRGGMVPWLFDMSLLKLRGTGRSWVLRAGVHSHTNARRIGNSSEGIQNV